MAKHPTTIHVPEVVLHNAPLMSLNLDEQLGTPAIVSPSPGPMSSSARDSMHSGSHVRTAAARAGERVNALLACVTACRLLVPRPPGRQIAYPHITKLYKHIDMHTNSCSFTHV